MQKGEYKLLPQRPRPSTFSNSMKKKFYSNYYDIKIPKQGPKIFQYHLEWSPQLPADSAHMLRRLISSIAKQLRLKLGMITHTGAIVWGTISNKISISFISKFRQQQRQYQYQITAKQTKQLNINSLLDSSQQMHLILPILNKMLKQKMHNIHAVEINRGKYFKRDSFKNNMIERVGLQVLRGYKYTLVPLNRGIYLQMDTCSRILRIDNLLQSWLNEDYDRIQQKYIGSIIITRYGNNKTYRIEDIDFKLNPLSTFHYDKNNSSITYRDYYHLCYNVQIRNNQQPLIKVFSKIQKVINDGKVQKVPHIIYLIPELVSLVGMSEEQKANYKVMKQITPFTQLSPNQRIKENQIMIKELNRQSSSLLIGQPLLMNGFTLDPPSIQIGGKTIQPVNGQFNIRETIKQPAVFNNWLFVYSLGNRDQKEDDLQARFSFEKLKKAGQAYGIRLKEPGWMAIRSKDVQQWIKQIEEDIKKYDEPQIIVFFLTENEERNYGLLKKYLINQKGVVSQCIRRRSILNSKNSLSIASKIILQMNIKIGQQIWTIIPRQKYIRQKNIMYGSICISKNRKMYTLSFVGTIDNKYKKIYSSCRTNITNKQCIQQSIFEQIFINWAKNYYKQNKYNADIIIIYRQQINQKYIKDIIQIQINALNTMIKIIQKKTKIINYYPQLVYILTSLRPTARFYDLHTQNYTKLYHNVRNPQSGSIVLGDMSSKNAFDFHLVAQNVNIGTATPTHYRVAYNNSCISEQILSNFTYEQCFNYYNWTGAVRVPACMQAADKLAKLVGKSIKQNISNEKISKTYYFL